MDGDLKHLASSDQNVKSDSPCIYLINLWIERLMTFDLDLDLYIGLTIISCFHIKKSFFWKFLEEIQVTFYKSYSGYLHLYDWVTINMILVISSRHIHYGKNDQCYQFLSHWYKHCQKSNPRSIHPPSPTTHQVHQEHWELQWIYSGTIFHFQYLISKRTRADIIIKLHHHHPQLFNTLQIDPKVLWSIGGVWYGYLKVWFE